jgi:hypothetical protein
MLNGKDVEGSVRGLTWSTSQHLPEGTKENHKKPLVGIADLWAKIWVQDLPNMKREC